MDLSWIGQTGVATVVASVISSGVVLYLDHRRAPRADLRLEAPRQVPDGKELERLFRLVNHGTATAVDVAISSPGGSGPPGLWFYEESGDNSFENVASLPVGESVAVVIRPLSPEIALRSTIRISWASSSTTKKRKVWERPYKEALESPYR